MYFSGVNQCGCPVQDVVLLDHIRRLIYGPGVHPFPCKCRTLALQRAEVEWPMCFNNGANFALRSNDLDHVIPLLTGAVQAEDVIHPLKIDLL